jgi:hypothetical protein
MMPGDLYRFNGRELFDVIIKGKFTHQIHPTTIDKNIIRAYSYGSQPIDPGTLTCTNQYKCYDSDYGKLYITYKGHIVPCCAYQTDLYNQGSYLQKLVNDISTVDLTKHKLSAIIEHPDFYLNRLEQDLSSKNTISSTCMSICKDRLLP